MRDLTEGRGTVPATAAQLQIYNHFQLHPEDAAFNLAASFQLHGVTDVARMRTALGRLVLGVRAFNTSFERRDGIVHAVRHRPALSPEDVVPVTRLAGPGREEVPRRLAESADRIIPPDSPVQYSDHIYVAEDGVFVNLLVSHLVCDAYTFYQCVPELERLYLSPDAELSPSTADDPGSLVTGTVPATPAAKEFFRRRLGRLATFADDRLLGSRTPGGALPGRQRSLLLDAGLSARLRARAEALDCSPFALFLSAFLVTHSRITGRRQIVTGVPLANRRGIRQRSAWGYFVNTLPLSVDLDAYRTFGELCRDVRETTHEMLRHQSFEVAAHAQEVCPRAAAKRAFAFDSAFTFYRQPLRISLPGCATEYLPLPRRLAKYPFSMNIEDCGDRFTVNVECSEEQWGTDPLGVMRQVLGQVADTGADLPLRTVSALGSTAEADLLGRINPGSGPSADRTVYPTPASLASWFDDTARRRPDRVAVRDGPLNVTYQELRERADRIARALVSEVPGEHVGVAMARGADLIAVILGVLKAGKAYVPLDPAAPAHRISRILESFPDGLTVVADERRRPDSGTRHLDAQTLLASDFPAPTPEPAPSPDSCAYVIFTSGSTGRPKGVQVTHHNVMRLFLAAEELFDFGPEDVWSLFHSCAFDFSVWEIFGALLHGGRLSIVPAATARSPEQFRDFLAEHRVTVLNQTPSAFGQLLKVLRPGDRQSLAVRYVVFGGEALRYASLRPWYDAMGDRAQLVNMYGITETTVHVTHHAISPGEALTERASLIGRPLGDLTVSIVDPDGHQCPPGVPGEIVVAGAGVTAGYLGLPHLTAERFVDHRGRAAYRSGDLGLARPDGSLVHLGRIDHQVQLSGFRIELGDVETALLSVDGVRECAVRMDERDPAHRALVGFFSGHDAPCPREVRRQLCGRLPGYMVPARLVPVDALPLNVNGKVDVDALPWPGTCTEAESRPDGAAPDRGADGALSAEALVLAVWQKVLPGTEIDLDDNFFDIGGSSMHVADMHQRLREQLPGLRIEMIDLFTYTTVRRLAAHIDNGQVIHA
ncbi:non-ribosomal peptide synthetase [Streptomyces blattellae]|uniref:non-ribosomal peptide synthetase n=1 Tax=Streptomyces blattellae TaxID=2569855 RepID=UPI0012B8072B|nr:amino acid adenylation domain-containing protein [Streptomyces blattellae]